MTSDDFAQALAALVPAPADYPGTPDLEEYAALQAEFTLIRLVQPRALPVVTHTELDELFARYEVVGMSACGITFFDVGWSSKNGHLSGMSSGGRTSHCPFLLDYLTCCHAMACASCGCYKTHSAVVSAPILGAPIL